MAVPVALAAALVCLYLIWQYRNLRNWSVVEPPLAGTGHLPSVAVIVPFRNEATCLPELLESLYRQDYDGPMEILLVDDHSTDGGGPATVPAGIRLRTLRLADHPAYLTGPAHKKAALRLGIDRTDMDVIVTTDADCVWPPGGLTAVGRRIAAGADVVLGNVFVAPVHDLCSAYQALDLAGYQLLTRASVIADTPTLANGANFAFRRRAFGEVDGYRGVDHLPSGDDVLLLHKFVADGGYVIRHADDAGAYVVTRPVTGWRALWKQRLRWAGKAGDYANPALIFAQVLAFAVSLTIVAGVFLSPFDPRFGAIGLAVWLGKAGVDYYLLRGICLRHGQWQLLRYYPIVQLIYPFFLVAVGAAALAGCKADWKGRA